ncbi:MAG: hypothetical protein IVW57_17770 [Ktedonobacterales bacterium]|nr:hypothetical protein [Ktedonobacterales bacterium]
MSGRDATHLQAQPPLVVAGIVKRFGATLAPRSPPRAAREPRTSGISVIEVSRDAVDLSLRGFGVADIWPDLLVLAGFATLMVVGAALSLRQDAL